MITFKTKPFAHQLDEFNTNKDRAAWGLFWEPGVGKSWPMINKAAHLYDSGEIRGMLVLAPNGVHRNWTVDQIPAHLPDEVAGDTLNFQWQTSKASTKKHQELAAAALAHKGMAMVAMSYDAVMTEEGRKFWKKFLDSRRCLYVLDESPRIKTPGSKRSMRIVGSSKAAPYRSILTGTIVANSPFDVYNQIRFLSPDAWGSIGCTDFNAFKQTFGIWRKQQISDGRGGVREFPMLVSYRNLELLQRIVAENGSRLLKEDVLDLPPKLYSTRYFDLTPAQKRAYKDIQNEFHTFLASGDMVSADLVITRLLRLQQITSGYLPGEDDRLVPLGDKNPRMDLLVECVEDAGHQVIVWAKYQQDITLILERLRAAGVTCVRYDGQCNEDEMGQAIDSFKAGNAQVFVGNPAKGCEGITLVNAKTMIYYNVSYRLDQRIQSEDRFHRIGQLDPVHIIDIAATDTVDVAIIEALRRKYEIAGAVQSDEIRSWI